MSISHDDLRAAVAAGILSEVQAARLKGLADSRRGARESVSAGDEPFELFKGFNEIFIVVGLGILAAGWLGVVTVQMTSEITNVQNAAIGYGLAGAAVLWALSEYFIRRRRMVAPAIALSALFAGNAAFALTAYFAQPFMIAQQDYASLPLPYALGTLCLGVFWWRFRVPFAMAMIAIGLFVVAMLVAATRSGTPEEISDLFLLSSDGPFAWITLALGAVVFAVAMAFDMSDPHRVTRRSANGFWLHVVAAPALVNTVALTLLTEESAASNMALIAVLALFAVVAVVIDRRSFLLAAIGYSVTLAVTVLDNEATASTILLFGVALLALGAFWDRIRAVLLSVLRPVLPLDKLPPSSL